MCRDRFCLREVFFLSSWLLRHIQTTATVHTMCDVKMASFMNIAQLLLLLLLLTTTNSQSDSSRAIKIINDSGRNLKLYWIDQSEGSHERLHLIDGTSLAEPGSQLSLSSFVGHVFEVHENPDPITGVCATDSGDQRCRVASFDVREDVLDEQSTWTRTLVLFFISCSVSTIWHCQSSTHT
jgi:hypothetical protein